MLQVTIMKQRHRKKQIQKQQHVNVLIGKFHKRLKSRLDKIKEVFNVIVNKAKTGSLS
jgi:hypothetical protein